MLSSCSACGPWRSLGEVVPTCEVYDHVQMKSYGEDCMARAQFHTAVVGDALSWSSDRPERPGGVLQATVCPRPLRPEEGGSLGAASNRVTYTHARRRGCRRQRLIVPVVLPCGIRGKLTAWVCLANTLLAASQSMCWYVCTVPITRVAPGLLRACLSEDILESAAVARWTSSAAATVEHESAGVRAANLHSCIQYCSSRPHLRD